MVIYNVVFIFIHLNVDENKNVDIQRVCIYIYKWTEKDEHGFTRVCIVLILVHHKKYYDDLQCCVRIYWFSLMKTKIKWQTCLYSRVNAETRWFTRTYTILILAEVKKKTRKNSLTTHQIHIYSYKSILL